jgi:hypothetical protein
MFKLLIPVITPISFDKKIEKKKRMNEASHITYNKKADIAAKVDTPPEI